MRPEWHEWGDDEPPPLTVGDVQRTVTAVIERALEDVGEDSKRWVALIGTLGSLSKTSHEAVVSRLAALDADNSVQVPSAQDCIRDAVHRRCESAALPERKLVHETSDELMRGIEDR